LKEDSKKGFLAELSSSPGKINLYSVLESIDEAATDEKIKGIILDLDNFFTDIHKYLRLLEEAIIKTCADYNIVTGRYPGYTGVWLDADQPTARKICAMGVRCSRWVTMHGFAFNVNTNLDYFKHIVPCGIDDKAVTSLEQELGHKIDMEEVKKKFLVHFENIFEAKNLLQ
jgi:lipoyl(octanoyl) transferase